LNLVQLKPVIVLFGNWKGRGLGVWPNHCLRNCLQWW